MAKLEWSSLPKKTKIEFFRYEISYLLLHACKLAVYTLACFTPTDMYKQFLIIIIIIIRIFFFLLFLGRTKQHKD